MLCTIWTVLCTIITLLDGWNCTAPCYALVVQHAPWAFLLGVHAGRGRRDIKAINAKAAGRFNGSASSHRGWESRTTRKHQSAPRIAAVYTNAFSKEPPSSAYDSSFIYGFLNLMTWHWQAKKLITQEKLKINNIAHQQTDNSGCASNLLVGWKWSNKLLISVRGRFVIF